MSQLLRLGGGTLLAAVLAGWGSPAAGQAAREAGAPDATWALDSLRAGFCVQFLMDPATAGAGRFRGAQLQTANAMANLHPALRRAVQDSAQFGSWFPAQFCVYQYGAVRSGSRVFEDRKRGEAQAIGIWTINTVPGAPAPVTLLADNSHLGTTVARLGVGVGTFRSTAGKVPESSDARYEVKYEGSVLTWDGRAGGDSTPVPALDRTFVTPGRNGMVYSVRFRTDAASARPMIGALRISGKGDLARALTASPIRYVGPLVWGGSGEIQFIP